MFEQRFESDWRPIDDRYDQVQALRDRDELLARRSQLKGDRHVPAPLTPARHTVGELRNPPRKRSKGTVPAFPQEQEMERSFAGIESARDLAIFRIMYHAGLRASEVGMLELRDYPAATERMMIHRLKGSNSGEQVGIATKLSLWFELSPGAITGASSSRCSSSAKAMRRPLSDELGRGPVATSTFWLYDSVFIESSFTGFIRKPRGKRLSCRCGNLAEGAIFL